MKNYFIKMILFILITSSFVSIYKEKNNNKILVENIVVNKNIYKSDITYNRYAEEKVYENLTLMELGAKIDKYFNSNLNGYGTKLAELALDKNVDPVIASSIILVETGCVKKCSSLVRNNNNIGGMRGNKGFMRFASLEEGLEAFINNLAHNYFAKGLNTPELINKKYASNPNWYKDVYYYVKLIKGN